jgi:hypothetical protein
MGKKTSVRITRDPAEIRTEHLPNMRSRVLSRDQPILIADSMTPLCVEVVKKKNSENPEQSVFSSSSFPFIACRPS